MRAGSKVCGTCHSTYRGRFSVHAGTIKHRAAARGIGGRLDRAGLDAVLGIRKPHIGRALAGDRGEDMERVKRHRRRKPLDGPRRDVKVDRYWRRRSWSGWGSLRAGARKLANDPWAFLGGKPG